MYVWVILVTASLHATCGFRSSRCHPNSLQNVILRDLDVLTDVCKMDFWDILVSSSSVQDDFMGYRGVILAAFTAYFWVIFVAFYQHAGCTIELSEYHRSSMQDVFLSRLGVIIAECALYFWVLLASSSLYARCAFESSKSIHRCMQYLFLSYFGVILTACKVYFWVILVSS